MAARLILVVLVACGAGCDSSSRAAPVPRPTASSTTPTTLRHASTPNNDPFIAHWSVHGSEMDIRSDRTGTLTSNCGGGECVETDRLTLVRSPNGKRLTATITSIRYSDTTGKSLPNPYPNESNAIGDSFYLEFVAPHLLRKTIIHSSLPVVDQASGNPYWCRRGLAKSLGHLCGA